MISISELAKSKGIRRKKFVLRPVRVKNAAEVRYRKVLLSLLDQLRSLVNSEIVSPLSSKLVSDASTAEEATNGISFIRRRAAEYVSVTEEIAKRIFTAEAKRHADAFRDIIHKAIGLDVSPVLDGDPDIDDMLRLRISENARLIRNVSDDVINRVERSVYQTIRSNESVKHLRNLIDVDFGFEQRRAKTIARDQTAKAVSDLNEIRQQKVGVEKYIWSTSQDERVRDSHIEKEGQEFRWDDPPSDTGHPGDDINCRCVARAVIEII